MKKIVLLMWLFLLGTVCFSQTNRQQVCRIGFTYEISQSPNWGKGKPVITSIHPYSFAQSSGLQCMDVIETIGGTPTVSLSTEEISKRLNRANREEVILTISNTGTHAKEILVKKECKPLNAIMEDQLAKAFSLYSPENTSEWSFSCPFRTTVTLQPIDFSQFRSFGFAAVDEVNSDLEVLINSLIEIELIKKGMSIDYIEPDIMIETFYLFDKNQEVTREKTEKETIYRYDINNQRKVRIPALPAGSTKEEADYLIQLGFRFVDKKINPGRILWECESNDLLTSPYPLDEYALLHIPLMCMQYPYVKYSNHVKFKVDQKRYNYTGIGYNIDRPEQILEVQPGSPAHIAGIRRGDLIEQIDNQSMELRTEEYTTYYKNFIRETMQYRDPETRFTDANGFDLCMFWDTAFYSQIADKIQNPDTYAPFSYLYYFAPYIHPEGNNICSFYIKRGDSRMEMVIHPRIRSEVTLTIQ